jgi:hypothetical protein
MNVSLTGLIKNACWELKGHGDPNAYAFMLQELLKHLIELKTRRLEGTAVIDEFFRLYIVNEKNPIQERET